MISRLRLCRATPKSARASASATVPIASTSTASYSPNIEFEHDGTKAERFAEGLWLLADHSLSRGRKNVHAKSVDTTDGLPRAIIYFNAFKPSIWQSFRCQSGSARQ